MKKLLHTICIICISFATLQAHNFAFNLTGIGANYLKTTSAPLTGNSSFTIEFWFNNNNNPYTDYGRLLGFDSYACEIGLINNNLGTLVVYDGSWRTTTAKGLNTGWHHVAITNDLTSMTVFVDGTQVYTKASATYNFTNKLMYLGISYGLATGDRIRAYIDEIRVWDNAETITQVNLIKDQQLVGNESSLVAYYPMENGTVNDLSTSGNDLISVGTVPRKDFDFGIYLNDYILNFDGTDDRTSAVSPLTGASDFTLEAQFKIPSNATTSYARIFSWDSYAFEVAVDNGTLATYKSSWVNTSATGLNDGQWHHVAVTRSGTVINIYVDGLEVGQRTITTINFSGNMYMGATYAPSDYFTGEIDEVRVWNTAISINTIRTNINKTLDTGLSNLVAYYDFNTPDTRVKNLVGGGSSLNRTGTSGTNNLPPFVDVPNKTVTPSVLSVTEGSRCGTGSVSLSAIASEGTIHWYTSATGGTSLGTGNTFNTPSIAVGTIYYAEASNNSVNSKRINVFADIISPPVTVASSNISSICSGLSATLTASGATTYSWNTGATTNSINVSPTVTTTYTLTGTENGCTSFDTVKVTVNTIPAVPTNTTSSGNLTVCPSSTTVLTASSTGTIDWYTSSTGGSSIYTGTSYTTPVLTSNKTYYAEANNNCGSSTRRSISIIVSSVSSAPVNTTNSGNSTICQGATATLSVTASGTISWYDVSTGGTSLSTGSSYTTAALTSNKSYYAEANGSCGTSSRTAIPIIVSSIPSAPVNTTSSINSSICSGTTATLSATASGTINWYDVSTGGTSLSTGTTYVTPELNSSTTFYVENNSTCGASIRTAIAISINSVPDASISSSGNMLFIASQPGANYKWFNCSDDSEITDSIAARFSPSVSGSYKAIVSFDSGCSDTSTCSLVTITVGIEENSIENKLIVFPNPSSGNCNIYSTSEGMYSIRNQFGQTIKTFFLNAANNHSVEIDNLVSGVYTIQGMQEVNAGIQLKIVVVH